MVVIERHEIVVISDTFTVESDSITTVFEIIFVANIYIIRIIFPYGVMSDKKTRDTSTVNLNS